MKTLIILVAASILTGCASITPDDLRADPSKKGTFTVAGDYRNVYRKILPEMRKCWTGSMLFGGGTSVDADIYEDTKIGTITAYSTALTTTFTAQVIEIRAMTDNNTEITGYYYASRPERMESIIKGWLNGNSGDCR